VLETAELRLQTEADVMAALHPTRSVRHAEQVFGRTLSDAALTVAGEAGHREAGTAVVDWIDRTRQIAQSDVANPVA
jgi:hypothetical protein